MRALEGSRFLENLSRRLIALSLRMKLYCFLPFASWRRSFCLQSRLTVAMQ